MKELTSFEGIKCTNCTTPLEGEFCHHCGQSVHSVLRPVHGLVEEFFEMFLHIDGRILHTVPPLFLKPGFLTLEYFSGRRVRYIAPFRLMFVLCLLSFFTLHLAADVISARVDQRHQHALITGSPSDFEDDDSADEVQKDLARKLASLEAARAANAQAGNNAAIATQIDSNEQQSRDNARQRLTELGMPASAASTAATQATASTPKKDEDRNTVDPVNIPWLPASANQRLTQLGQHMHDNVEAVFKGNPAERQEARERLITNVFGALPGTMLVLIPTFALLLTLVYIFKRRLYMEHLIVALHSHAFIFLSLLLIIVAGMLSTWLKPHAAWTGWVLGFGQGALMVWVPAYLLVMQKRIYRQGWVMTIVKFLLIGWAYIWLLSLALAMAAVLGLAH
ncbi:DUF3667 domain-containing protein [Dyella caseinilytica]|uniref:DUF3667 domain-containing protein n=1 Tax=Dyella caseinilytica TaxID=1849581 RepID=A0ABX7GS40_9GAMM|nr:DUF3667 domain-containing protein [Dyella caseinilytica]QRN53196.1 DUF3667 domain-containing protein [Dyella caseinilytica]GGA12184.1 hypothetical protein GCM10011408_37090 [Dyella caseinilytica]